MFFSTTIPTSQYTYLLLFISSAGGHLIPLLRLLHRLLLPPHPHPLPLSPPIHLVLPPHASKKNKALPAAPLPPRSHHLQKAARGRSHPMTIIYRMLSYLSKLAGQRRRRGGGKGTFWRERGVRFMVFLPLSRLSMRRKKEEEWWEGHVWLVRLDRLMLVV